MTPMISKGYQDKWNATFYATILYHNQAADYSLWVIDKKESSEKYMVLQKP